MIAGCNIMRAYVDPPVLTAIAFLVDATRTRWYETDLLGVQPRLGPTQWHRRRAWLHIELSEINSRVRRRYRLAVFLTQGGEMDSSIAAFIVFKPNKKTWIVAMSQHRTGRGFGYGKLDANLLLHRLRVS